MPATYRTEHHNEHVDLNACEVLEDGVNAGHRGCSAPRTRALPIRPRAALSAKQTCRQLGRLHLSSIDRPLMGIVTDQKITDLFLRRGLWHYAQRVLSPRLFDQWAQMAFAVQRRIYDLDEHYETTATLGGKDEFCLWRKLSNAETLVSTTGSEALQRAIVDLRDYASDEARIHAGIEFDREEWLAIAYRKSADVSLARELAFGLMGRHAPSAAARGVLRLYDQVMEVLEDLDDLHEDWDDWNLNFWLTPIRQGVPADSSVANMHRVIKILCRDVQSAWDRLCIDGQRAHVSLWDDLREQVFHCLKHRKLQLSLLSTIPYVPYKYL